MAPEDACSADMLVLIRWQDQIDPLSQLAAVNPDDSTAEAVVVTGIIAGAGLLFLIYRTAAESSQYL
jgi:hypothetical protein